MILVAILAVTCVLLFLGSMAVVKLRPDWSLRRVVIAVAIPLPLVLFCVSLIAFLDASEAMGQGCEIDVCEPRGYVAAGGMFYGFFLFIAGMIIAGSVASKFGKSTSGEHTESFEA
ncbi:MAG: hypothetical protein Q8R81_11690 [Novosphingobium sp.]|uniref:hypothetical protein n=1 Tax=Novosphingobium sp. TaxID=1874826 RepID=UPI0027369DDE|nr:hypothetical protein [Novosphingobium sp.]MDP3551044.1 hypothetical protein [Novosphingobium sp.]